MDETNAASFHPSDCEDENITTTCISDARGGDVAAAECQLILHKLALIAWYSTKWLAQTSYTVVKKTIHEIRTNDDFGQKTLELIERTRVWVVNQADQMLKNEASGSPAVSALQPAPEFSDTF